MQSAQISNGHSWVSQNLWKLLIEKKNSQCQGFEPRSRCVRLTDALAGLASEDFRTDEQLRLLYNGASR